MCLIIHKPKNKRVPLEILQVAAYKNPHGFGITYLDSGKTERAMQCPSLKYLATTKRPYVVHFRFATVGAKTVHNCHPFRIR